MFALKREREELERAYDLLEGYLEEDSCVQVSENITTPNLPGLKSIARDMSAAGLGQNDFNAFYQKQVSCLILVITLTIFTNKFIVLALSPIYFVVSRFSISFKVKKRSAAFEKDYTALLLSLASAIRTGMDPLYALCESRKMFSSNTVIFEELQKTTNAVDRGVSEFEVIQDFASSIRHPDIKLFRTAFLLARIEGSSLGECLQRLARVTRQRQSFRRKIKGAVAMQKLSAIGIAACTIVIGLIQFSTNPEAVQTALAHPAGSKLLYGGLSLIVLGLFWMMNLAKARV